MKTIFEKLFVRSFISSIVLFLFIFSLIYYYHVPSYALIPLLIYISLETAKQCYLDIQGRKSTSFFNLAANTNWKWVASRFLVILVGVYLLFFFINRL